MKIALMVGQTVGLIAVGIAAKFGISSIIAYDNEELYKELDFKVYNTIQDERFIVDVAKSNILLCVHGREIVPVELLRKVRYAINIHPYYNFYKGMSPIKRALAEGNIDADVTAHEMTEQVDEGKILRQAKTLVSGITEEDIYKELYPLYAKVIKGVIRDCVTNDKNIFITT